MSLAVLIPLATGLLAVIFTYYGTVRKLSGSIQTSTAEDLWQESKQIRLELTDRLGQLQGRIDSLIVENVRLRQEVEECRMELLKMKLKYEDGVL